MKISELTLGSFLSAIRWTFFSPNYHVGVLIGLGGGTRIIGRTGMCRSNGLLFYKKSLNMGPVFYQKILKHGSTFLIEPKNHKIFEIWAYFSRKIFKNGYPFLPKSPLKMGNGFEARAAYPCPTQNLAYWSMCVHLWRTLLHNASQKK